MSKKKKKVDPSHNDVLGDFFIVNIINKNDESLNDIAGIFRTQEAVSKFLMSQRSFMHSKHEDVFHTFPEEWSFVIDKYVGYVMRPDDMVVIPLRSLCPEK